MQSIGAEERSRKPFRKTKFGHGQLILSVVPRCVQNRSVCVRTFCTGTYGEHFVEISFPHRRRNDEDR
jgi:hypothetical protein